MDWFQVDREGLRLLLGIRGIGRLIWELLQNCWDENVTKVTVTLETIPNKAAAILTVEDDSPEGFVDLSLAWTLFAESPKKGDPERRGLWCLGEKLVLSLAKWAEISSTTGTVVFDNKGRHQKRKKREKGSLFTCELPMTRKEYEEACEQVKFLIPPEGIVTMFNGEVLEARKPICVFETILPTQFAGEDGSLRRTKRKTTVKVYEPQGDEKPSIYEMGIPVVGTDDKWHYDVAQKVPLNMDRDNVPPSFLQAVRVEVVNQMHDDLTEEDATQGWVQEASEDDRCQKDAFNQVLDLRFGEDRVISDPSNPEADRRAVAAGKTLMTGGSMSKGAWKNVRRYESALPSGREFPTTYEGGVDSDGEPVKPLPEDKWSEGMRSIADYAVGLADRLMDVSITVVFVRDPAGFKAAYGGRRLIFNLRFLGRAWFGNGPSEKVDKLILHEFGHQFSGDHLSSDYHEALCQLGARLKQVALRDPEFFRKFEPVTA